MQKTAATAPSGNYALVQVAEALTKAGVKLVPDIVAGGGASGGGTLVNVLLGNMMLDGMKNAGRGLNFVPHNQKNGLPRQPVFLMESNADKPASLPLE